MEKNLIRYLKKKLNSSYFLCNRYYLKLILHLKNLNIFTLYLHSIINLLYYYINHLHSVFTINPITKLNKDIALTNIKLLMIWWHCQLLLYSTFSLSSNLENCYRAKNIFILNIQGQLLLYADKDKIKHKKT